MTVNDASLGESGSKLSKVAATSLLMGVTRASSEAYVNSECKLSIKYDCQFAHEGRLLVTLVSRNARFAHEGRPRVSLVSRNARFAHEGRLLVTLVSQNVCFAHEGRLLVTLVSQSACFAHEGRLRV